MWYYLSDDNQQHEVTDEEFAILARRQVVRKDTMVWHPSLSGWERADQAKPDLFVSLSSPETGTEPQPPNPWQRKGNSDEIDFTILGDDMQIVEIELDPQEMVVAEAGAMNYVEEGIQFDSKMGDGSDDAPDGMMGALKKMGSRVLTGESLFMTHFRNEGRAKAKVAFAAPYPGKIIPVDLASVGGELLCQKDAFLCAARGTQLSIAFNKNFGTGLFGGEGFILQRLRGDGMAFVHAGGTVVKRELKGETLRVDTGCLVAFDTGIDYSIERAGNLKSMVFGGEGIFLATLRGHGTVYLQSLPFARLADRIISQTGIGRKQGEGSILGGIGLGR